MDERKVVFVTSSWVERFHGKEGWEGAVADT